MVNVLFIYKGEKILFNNLKLFTIGLIVFLLITACSSGANDEEKLISNDEFLKELSAGLEERWDYTNKNENEEVTKEILTEAIDLELNKVEEFKDLKFEDDKLKEYAISYINELKSGLETLDSFGADSFYEKWDEHYNKRTTIILEIDDIYEIPISSEYISILDELKATGKEVLEKSEKNDEIDKFIKNIEFELDQDQSDEYLQYYIAIVENTTDYNFKDFSIDLKLIDSDGVTVETEYAYTSNWDKGDKAKLEFMTTEEFDKVEVIKNYIETD